MEVIVVVPAVIGVEDSGPFTLRTREGSAPDDGVGLRLHHTRIENGETLMQLNLSAGSGAGLESESSLTGTFQVSLTRAVLPYRDDGDRALPGGRIGDIGLGVVVDGSDPARADVLDLGSAELRVVDLTGPLVVLGWLYPSGLRSLERVVEDAGLDDRDRARAFTFNMAVRALNAAGFGPLTRPTVLRIGFRDLCLDLDLHEGTAVRLLLPSGGVARIHLDYETSTRVTRIGSSVPSRDLESALVAAFAGRELLRGKAGSPVSAHAYHLPLPIPRSLADTRALLGRLREGFTQLLARFEPERSRSTRELTSTLGERDSLRGLTEKADAPPMESVRVSSRAETGAGGVH